MLALARPMSRRRPPSLFARCLVAAVVAACADDAGTGTGAQAGSGAGTGAGGSGGQGGAPTSTSTGIDLTTTSTGGSLPQSFSVQGLVVDEDDEPLEGALVLQGGGDIQLQTGPDGAFEVTLTQAIPGYVTVVAAKIGYRSAGLELIELPDEPVVLKLFSIEAPDNQAYKFLEPGVGDHAADNKTSFCGHCHTTFAAQFQTSAHARSVRSPIVQDLYAGVATAASSAADCAAVGGVRKNGAVPGEPGSSTLRCYVGDGVLPDLNDECGGAAQPACDDPALPMAQKPKAFGACADCHGFGMDGPSGGRDLLEAEGVGYDNGVHCDACHHIRDIDLDAPAGAGGRLVLQRPRETIDGQIGSPIRPAMFGPLPDVPNPFMGGSYQPKFTTSELCAGCHQHEQAALVPDAELAPRFAAGLPVHSTFEEFSLGPYPALGFECQSCHMPPVDGMFNSIDVASADVAGLANGFGRDPQRNRSHAFIGPLTKIPAVPRLIDGALSVEIDASIAADTLSVDVALTNVGCGHAIPTGEPLRAVVLVVDATACDVPLTPTGGLLIPDVGGARATGAVGPGLSFAGTTLTWAAAAESAAPGMRVRVVRPTGTFWDYDGVGLFDGDSLTPSEKGVERLQPIGEAEVLALAGDDLELDAALAVAAGDVVYLVDDPPSGFLDGDPSSALAGAAGAVFARVLVDPDGRRMVPHHRAIDIASDTRIGPQRTTTTDHVFAVPPGCTDALITATVLYRPLPLALADERRWQGSDAIIAVETRSLP
ncbi:MAG: carboxypeptidase regulatory-like domain-containing protein [Polyangiaceae bacterium]|nr:carboxypeptidase regulatory-like domain-containing protein [Polyangiaceae bacterium]MBK8939697.1 carboxypeptidase regulatory-like domain-containing protein [Polyangiaceae bacterium]